MNDSSDEGAAFVAGVFVGLLIAAIAVFIVLGINRGRWEREAVAKGKAEYILNEKDGTSTWRWKE